MHVLPKGPAGPSVCDTAPPEPTAAAELHIRLEPATVSLPPAGKAVVVVLDIRITPATP